MKAVDHRSHMRQQTVYEETMTCLPVAEGFVTVVLRRLSFQ